MILTAEEMGCILSAYDMIDEYGVKIRRGYVATNIVYSSNLICLLKFSLARTLVSLILSHSSGENKS